MSLRARSHWRKRLTFFGFLLQLLLAAACSRTPPNEAAQTSAIAFIGWGPATQRDLSTDQSILEGFTRETGIRVNFIPGPESMTDRLQLYHRYFEAKSTTPDVYYVDVVWPALLADQFLDLHPYLAKEAAEELDAPLQNNIVQGRLIAMPFNAELGLLYYRADLLQKYGYQHAPKTWDELETMAARVQAGERAAGNHDFWGFVWQGAAYEGLTCNALEWQVSYGGGRIIEPDGTITVNNPQTIQAMRKARGWIGTISPPSQVAFLEQDARNAFNSGNAAFERDWLWRQFQGESLASNPKSRVAVTLLPGGPAGQAATIGGQSLAISKYSQHPREAAALIRYLTSHDEQIHLWKMHAMLPSRREFYSTPSYLQERPGIALLWNQLGSVAVARPSTVAGTHYEEVSRAYYQSVHAILTGEADAAKAIAELETKLVKITGGKTGPPPPPVGSAGH